MACQANYFFWSVKEPPGCPVGCNTSRRSLYRPLCNLYSVVSFVPKSPLNFLCFLNVAYSYVHIVFVNNVWSCCSVDCSYPHIWMATPDVKLNFPTNGIHPYFRRVGFRNAWATICDRWNPRKLKFLSAHGMFMYDAAKWARWGEKKQIWGGIENRYVSADTKRWIIDLTENYRVMLDYYFKLRQIFFLFSPLNQNFVPSRPGIASEYISIV